MKRRKFLRDASLLTGTMFLTPSVLKAQESSGQLVSVLGPIKPADLGVTLVHEHVMADFIGAARTGAHRYDSNQVFEKALPYLIKLKESG
ncbi:MAG: hypothetical protein C0490_26955, partial [Marivirga sp.]|nr:hypothetical protein [Marivirga sp.]